MTSKRNALVARGDGKMIVRIGIFLVIVVAAVSASAQCPKDVVRVQGRVDNLPADADNVEVFVLVESPKGNTSQAGRASNGEFSIDVPFRTESGPYSPLLGHRCKNVPRHVTVKASAGTRVLSEKKLEFRKNFELKNSYIYSLKSPLVLDASKPPEPSQAK